MCFDLDMLLIISNRTMWSSTVRICWKTYIPDFFAVSLITIYLWKGACAFIWTNWEPLHPRMFCAMFAFQKKKNVEIIAVFLRLKWGKVLLLNPLLQLFVSNQGRQKQECNLARNISTPVNLQVWNTNKNLRRSTYVLCE